MENEILLFGGGEIGSYLKLHPKVVYENYSNIENIDFSSYSSVINCTFDKNYFRLEADIKKMFDWRLLNVAERYPDLKFIFLSSRLVFDRSQITIYENTPFDKNPFNEYARKKILLEKELMNIPNAVVVRLPNVFSASTPVNRFFGQLLNDFCVKKKIYFDFMIDELREFVFAGDVAQFLLWLTYSDFQGCINYSYSDKITARDFIRIFQNEFGNCEVAFENTPSNVQFTFDHSLVSKIYKKSKFESNEKAMKKVHAEWIK